MTREHMEAMIEDFEMDLEESEKSEGTIKRYTLVARQFVESLPDEGDIAKKHVVAFKKKIMAEYSEATVQLYITIANKFIAYCEYETLERTGNKSRLEVKHPRSQKNFTADNVLSESEYLRMVRYARRLGYDDMALIMKIFAFTGIRENELKEFTVENLKNTTKVVVHSKGKLREVNMPASLSREINRYIRDKGIESGYVFTSSRDRHALIPARTINWRLKKIAGKARISLDKAHAHSFRHMFTKKLVDMGYPIPIVADILGHSSTETTRVYIHKSSGEIRNIINSIKYEGEEDEKKPQK